MHFRLRPVEIPRYERRTVEGRLEPIDHCQANGRNRRNPVVAGALRRMSLHNPICRRSCFAYTTKALRRTALNTPPVNSAAPAQGGALFSYARLTLIRAALSM